MIRHICPLSPLQFGLFADFGASVQIPQEHELVLSQQLLEHSNGNYQQQCCLMDWNLAWMLPGLEPMLHLHSKKNKKQKLMLAKGTFVRMQLSDYFIVQGCHKHTKFNFLDLRLTFSKLPDFSQTNIQHKIKT